jgi:predicted Holliday junction resolvase-like endonuclease
VVSGSGGLILVALLLLVAVAALAFVVLKYIQLQSRLTDHTRQYVQLQANLNDRVRLQFEHWRERELESVRVQIWQTAQADAQNTLVRWQMETESSIRADAIARSSAVVRGKVTEHLTPYLGVFPYNPKDVRFLGSPVDLVIFDGMNDNDLREIIFLEIKTGSATMSTRERRIRDIVQARQVSWREFRVAVES